MRRTLFTTLTAAAALALSAEAGEAVTYDVDGMTYEGYLAEATREAKGLVIIIHDWGGLDDYEKTRAEMLADEGYDAFAVDLYGAGNRPDTTEARKELVGQLYGDRDMMRARILGGIAKAREVSGENEAIVMGYCFGGGATLELARSGEGEGIAGYATLAASMRPKAPTIRRRTPPYWSCMAGPMRASRTRSPRRRPMQWKRLV